MSFGILQTFFNRLHAQGKISQIPDIETFYRRFEVDDRAYSQIIQEVVEEERPPMIEIESYRNRKELTPRFFNLFQLHEGRSIVHYHLEPGGVTRVIENTLLGWKEADTEIETVVLSGRSTIR